MDTCFSYIQFSVGWTPLMQIQLCLYTAHIAHLASPIVIPYFYKSKMNVKEIQILHKRKQIIISTSQEISWRKCNWLQNQGEVNAKLIRKKWLCVSLVSIHSVSFNLEMKLQIKTVGHKIRLQSIRSYFGFYVFDPNKNSPHLFVLLVYYFPHRPRQNWGIYRCRWKSFSVTC